MRRIFVWRWSDCNEKDCEKSESEKTRRTIFFWKWNPGGGVTGWSLERGSYQKIRRERWGDGSFRQRTVTETFKALSFTHTHSCERERETSFNAGMGTVLFGIDTWWSFIGINNPTCLSRCYGCPYGPRLEYILKEFVYLNF